MINKTSCPSHKELIFSHNFLDLNGLILFKKKRKQVLIRLRLKLHSPLIVLSSDMMNKFFKLDWVLISAVVLLLIISLLALYSISFDGAVLDSVNLKKQAISIIIGFALMLSLAFLDYRRLDDYSTKFYFLIII